MGLEFPTYDIALCSSCGICVRNPLTAENGCGRSLVVARSPRSLPYGLTNLPCGRVRRTHGSLSIRCRDAPTGSCICFRPLLCPVNRAHGEERAGGSEPPRLRAQVVATLFALEYGLLGSLLFVPPSFDTTSCCRKAHVHPNADRTRTRVCLLFPSLDFDV